MQTCTRPLQVILVHVPLTACIKFNYLNTIRMTTMTTMTRTPPAAPPITGPIDEPPDSAGGCSVSPGERSYGSHTMYTAQRKVDRGQKERERGNLFDHRE
eukprot:scpid43753/ scgid26375/ 